MEPITSNDSMRRTPKEFNSAFIHVDTVEDRTDNMNQPVSNYCCFTFDGQYFESNDKTQEGLANLTNFCKRNNVKYFWGYPTTDSIVRLQLIYQQYDLSYPWDWRQVNDAATLLRLYRDQPTTKKIVSREYCENVVDKIKARLLDRNVGVYLYNNLIVPPIPLFDLSHFSLNIVFFSVGAIFGSLLAGG